MLLGGVIILFLHWHSRMNSFIQGGHVAEVDLEDEDEEYDEEEEKEADNNALPVTPSTKKRTLDEAQEGEDSGNNEAKKTKV
jgi:hypothetical protein